MSILDTHKCVCPLPGFCPHFGDEMPENFHRVCSGDPGIEPANRIALLEQWEAERRDRVAATANPPRKDRSCTHLGPPTGETRECLPCGGKTRQKVFGCAIHGETTLADCRRCKDYILRGEEPGGMGDGHHEHDHFALSFTKSATLALHSAEGAADRSHEGRWRGETAFFLGGGPSLATVDLGRLDGRLTLAVNDVIGLYPNPSIWLTCDDPAKFPAAPWESPGTLKLLPREWAGCELEDGTPLAELDSVRFFLRNGRFHPWSFLTERTVNWGSDVDFGAARSVMLAAFKLLWYFGVARVVLLGCDFHMDPTRPYAHDAAKAEDACRRNNDKFRILDRRFAMLRPLLEAGGMVVVNATDGSKLEAFERVGLDRELFEAAQNL